MERKLTKRAVDALDVRNAEYWVADTAIRGFGVRVFPSGKKSFVYRYRIGDTRRTKVIGIYGQPYGREGRGLTADQARKVAERLQGMVRAGEDPKALEDEERQAMTVSELCDAYLKDAKAGRVLTRSGAQKSPNTLATDEGRIERHIKPLIGKKKARDITKADVEWFRDAVTGGQSKIDEKTDKPGGRSIVTGGAGTASRTLGLLGGIFSYAEEKRIVASNPVRGVKRKADQKRLRTLSQKDYQAIGKALKLPEKATDGQKKAVQAIKVLLLTGCRKGEILGLKKQEIDSDAQALRLGNTKTGAQVRPIGREALKLLNSKDWDEKSEFVFPATRGKGHLVGVPRAWEKIRKEIGLDDVSLHTFRHGYASVAAELGYSEITIAGLLGHASSSVTGRYIHLVDPAVVAAADKVSAEIARRLGLQESAKIVRLKA